ncbi:hypothetical protein MF573_04165 [Klebsiella pneumoniae]|nr:hypothetical protein MF573_04165 [Klebsiella pneumoniae]
MVGLSCACFCKLNKGGWDGAVITFLRQYGRDVYSPAAGTTLHLHPQINFCLTAFAATTISGLLLQLPSVCQQYPHRCDGRQRSAAGAGLSVDKCRRRYV